MKATKLFLLGLGLLTAPSALLPAARADDCYGAFTVRNPSGNALHYQVRWGDGDWKPYCVYPHQRTWHGHPLDGDGRAPTPCVRFDRVAGDGQTTYQSYRIGVHSTADRTRGKGYVFRYSRCGCYLSLYAE